MKSIEYYTCIDCEYSHNIPHTLRFECGYSSWWRKLWRKKKHIECNDLSCRHFKLDKRFKEEEK